MTRYIIGGAFVAAVFGIVMLASSGSAECAWVLWASVSDDKVSTDRYQYVDACTTKPRCDEEAAFGNRNI